MLDLWKVPEDGAFVKYAESDSLLIGSLYENGYLFHLATKEVTYLNWFYGNPTCGIISPDSNWAAMGGNEELTLWREGIIFDFPIKNIFDIRYISSEIVHVLTDPWLEGSAILELNISTRVIEIVRLFNDYINKEYTDDVVW